jgi:CubicO group peptidase (beta-lactamase class C family)
VGSRGDGSVKDAEWRSEGGGECGDLAPGRFVLVPSGQPIRKGVDFGCGHEFSISMRWLCAAGLSLMLIAAGFARDVGRLADAVKAGAEGDRFMGSVLVAEGDTVVFEQSAGRANVEWEIANAATTKFRIGSVTKQFTAAAILLLEERGKLQVDDPIAKHISGVPAAWQPITLRHLLNHTSGVPNFTGLPKYKEWKISGLPASLLLEQVRDLPLDFEPGTKYKYSNTGYVLLGWVAELASGQTYREFVQKNIFEPLGMTASGYDSGVAIIPQRAAGYDVGAVGLRKRNANYIDMRTPGGAGALYSTTGDLLKWTRALFGGKLLKPASLEKMTTPAKGDYAFGLLVGTKDGRKRITHAGGIDGFGSFLAYFPETEVTIVVLSNVEGPAASQLAARLETIYFGL